MKRCVGIFLAAIYMISLAFLFGCADMESVDLVPTGENVVTPGLTSTPTLSPSPSPEPTPTPMPEPEVFYEGAFEYYVEGGEAIICDYIYNGPIEIPSSLGGLPVTGIGYEAFSNAERLEEVILPDTIKTIGERAFINTNLKKINFPDSLTSIGADAFNRCDLTTIDLSSDLTYIGDRAFFSCNLQQVVIPEGLIYIGDEAFAYNETLVSIKFPSTIEHIGINVFYFCYRLANVDLSRENEYFSMQDDSILSKDGTVLYLCLYHDNREQEGDSAVYHQGDYTIPEGVMRIAGHAFSGTMNLDVYIPESVITVDEAAFVGINPMQAWGADANSQQYGGIRSGNSTLYNSDFTLLLYQGLDEQETYDISKDIARIGSYSFEWRNDNPKTINIPNSVTSIGDYAFHVSAISELNLPDSVSEIGEYAFARSHLRKVTLNQSLSTINEGTFIQCKFSEISLPNNITRIEEEAFAVTSLSEITIPDSVVYIGKRAFDLSDLSSVILSENLVKIEDGTFQNCHALREINIPNRVLSIGNSAFYWCDSLEQVTLSKYLKSIGSRAFERCSSLKDVVLPESLEIIENQAFQECPSITDIEIPGSVKTIGTRAFYGCYSMNTVNISEGVEFIGDGVFYQCSSLVSIFIPASVSYIGEDALGSDYGRDYGNLVVHTTEGSYASQYAAERGIPCIID